MDISLILTGRDGLEPVVPAKTCKSLLGKRGALISRMLVGPGYPLSL
jgi:hypothetical protein